MRHHLGYFVLAFHLSAALPALAGPPTTPASPPDVTAQADDLFRQAREAMRQKDYRRALKLLKTSHEVDPGVGKLANMAICEEALGMVASALSHFQAVEQQLSPEDDRRPTVEKYLAALPARLPYLRIVLAAAAGGARVLLDDVAVAPSALGQDVPIDPGEHWVFVTAAGRPGREYVVTSEEGKRTVLTVEPGAVAAPALSEALGPSAMIPPSPMLAPAPEPAKRSIVPVVILGAVGAAGIGTGVAFVLMREVLRADAGHFGEEIDASGTSCVPGSGFNYAFCPRLNKATATGDAFGTVAWVGFVTGGLVAAGALTYALWPRAGASTASGVALSVVPVLGLREQGISLAGSF